VSFVVECSKGTYIRSLCDDIGKRLGCGAAMETLKRTRVGSFRIEDSITLLALEENFKSMDYDKFIDQFVLSSDSVFMDYDKAVIKGECLAALLNGNKLYERQLDFENNNFIIDEGKNIRVYDDKGEFKAVYTYIQKEGCFKPYKMFL
jgi:tRNA pseudouridine55 synthase